MPMRRPSLLVVAALAVAVAVAGPGTAQAQAQAPGVVLMVGPYGSEAETRGGASPGDRFVLASVSKTMMAVAMLRLAERGEIDLDGPVTGLVPEAIAGAYGGLDGLTMAHLLGMRSGLPDYYDEAFLEADLAGPVGLEAALIHGAGAPLFAAGTAFDYSNTNYLLAELIAREVTGLDLQALLMREVFQPAGMAGAYVVGTRAPGPGFVLPELEWLAPDEVARLYGDPGFADGGVVANAEEVARFYRALFFEGALLTEDSLTRLIGDPEGDGYGLGIEVERSGRLGPVVGHSGGDVGYTADVRFAVTLGLIAVELTAEDDGAGRGAWDALHETCRC